MADIKFTQLLPLDGANVTKDTVFPVVENGFNWQLSTANLQPFMSYNPTGNTVSDVFVGNSFRYAGNGAPVDNYHNSNVAAYLPTDPLIISMEANIANNTSNIIILSNTVSTFSNAIANNTANITILQGNVITLQNNLSNTNSNVANNTANISILQGNVITLQTGLANTDSNVANNTANIATIFANIATLQNNSYANSNVTAFLASGSFNTSIYSNTTAAPYVLQNYKEAVYPLTYSSTLAPAPLDGAIQKVTLTGNVTINGLAAGAPAGTNVALIIVQDGVGSRVLTSNMKFAGGFKTLSTAANSTDIMSIFFDGTTYYATLNTGYI